MLRTIVYMRKSSEEDSKQVQSIERQKRDIYAFLERHNASSDYENRLDVKDGDFIEEEKTAKEPGREKFNHMIGLIKKGRYEVLLCTEPSRLSRNPLDTGMLIHIMDKEYIESIRTITGTYSSKSVTDKFTLGLFLSISKYENDQRGVNTSSGMQNRKSQGATTNIANMGYRNCGEQKGSRAVEPDGENFDTLQDAWKMLLTGQYKVSEIYDWIKKQGFTRISSYKDGIAREVPSRSALRAAFRNPYYMGLLKNGVQGKHKPMVSKEEFEKAQVILQKTGWKHSKMVENVTYDNLLEEILVCGKTGNPFYVNVKTRYYCPTKNCSERYYSAQGPKECPKCGRIYEKSEYERISSRKTYDVRNAKHLVVGPNGKHISKGSFEASEIETLVDAQIAKVRISEGLFQIFRRQLYTLWLEQSEATKKLIKKKREEIEKIEDKRRKLNGSLFSEEMDEQAKADLEANIEDLIRKQRNTQTEIEDLQEQEDEEFELAWQSLNVLLEARTVFAPSGETSFEPKRKLVLSLFSNLKFIDGEIIPEWREPFATMVNSGALTKKKSQTKSEISKLDSKWLPEQDSNLGPTG